MLDRARALLVWERDLERNQIHSGDLPADGQQGRKPIVGRERQSGASLGVPLHDGGALRLRSLEGALDGVVENLTVPHESEEGGFECRAERHDVAEQPGLARLDGRSHTYAEARIGDTLRE